MFTVNLISHFNGRLKLGYQYLYDNLDEAINKAVTVVKVALHDEIKELRLNNVPDNETPMLLSEDEIRETIVEDLEWVDENGECGIFIGQTES